MGLILVSHPPFAYNLTLLEELNFDYCPVFNLMREDMLISWLHLLAKVKIMTLNFHILDRIVNVSYFSILSPLHIFYYVSHDIFF
jgi:hypothetical protein